MSDKKNGLAPLTFVPLSLGSVKPKGWLKNQLRIQADGLSGHLDEFWPDVADSGWIGGKAEGWERGPYWLDGIIPLAFLLDDEKLKEKARDWIDYIVTHQHSDGWLGPVRDERYDRYEAYDPWPVFVTLKAMTQYQEATGDTRIIPAMEKFFQRLDKLLDEKPLFSWGKSRWADLVLSIHWLYDRTGQEWLLDLSAKAHEQGYDWRGHFADFQWKQKMKADECNQTTHVVNNGMAVKQPGVWYRQSKDQGDRESVFQIIETLDKYHGQVTGLFTGDEHYAGKSPSQGTELCAVVEYMFSLENLISILGDTRLADRLEKITFNALPATFSPDMWSHQYDQQANQVVCKVSEDRVYTNNGPYANVFGLEPNYGCCTANMHQGWPKFASHLWMKTPDDGLVASAYAPSEVTTEISGTQVTVSLETDYPFGEDLKFTIKTDKPVEFPLYLRIPEWSENAMVKVNGEIVETRAGEYFPIKKKWDKIRLVDLNTPMKVKAQKRYNDSVALERGPLVYSLKMEEEWKQIGGEKPHADWEIYPKTDWNYALKIDMENPEKCVKIKLKKVGDMPFSPDGAPLTMKVKGKKIPEWGIEHNAAAPPPESSISSSESEEELELIPYGATNLRVTEFPKLK
ncbi:hypothetical protein GF312_15840 [Candidatus Poribacteria bacterium]|nr:hypothetical protein [Candidatus Poribacteria bacterium]